jgi:hypothetical protein
LVKQGYQLRHDVGSSPTSPSFQSSENPNKRKLQMANTEVRLPQAGDEFDIRNKETGEVTKLVVLSTAKRGRGYQVLTDHGKFRLKNFTALISEPLNVGV